MPQIVAHKVQYLYPRIFYVRKVGRKAPTSVLKRPRSAYSRNTRLTFTGDLRVASRPERVA